MRGRVVQSLDRGAEVGRRQCGTTPVPRMRLGLRERLARRLPQPRAPEQLPHPADTATSSRRVEAVAAPECASVSRPYRRSHARRSSVGTPCAARELTDLQAEPYHSIGHSVQSIDKDLTNHSESHTLLRQTLNRTKEVSTVKKLDVLAAILVIVGGLNWGLSRSPSSTWSPRSSASNSARRTPRATSSTGSSVGRRLPDRAAGGDPPSLVVHRHRLTERGRA